MTTTALYLLDQIIVALKGPSGGPAPTAAGQSVFSPRDWPTWDGQYPCVLTQVLSDVKQSQGNASIGFTVTSTIRVICRASAPGGDDDLGTTTAETEAWGMARQVEVAVINSAIMAACGLQQYPSIVSNIQITSDGENSVADVAVDIAMEYYLDATDFAVIAGSEITEQTAATSATDYTNNTRIAPGMDITTTP